MLPDQSLDQTLDHKTKSSGPNLLVQAEKLLSAVAGGEPSSFQLAKRLCEAVLASQTFAQAREALALLESQSLFALVRAVSLAELVIEEATKVSSQRVPTTGRQDPA